MRSLFNRILGTLRRSLPELALSAALLSGIFAPAYSQTQTPDLNTIVSVGTGWAADVISVRVDKTVVNPAGCANIDAYMTDSTQPGFKTHYAAVLTAFATGRQIKVTVWNGPGASSCVHGRPAIIAIDVY